MVRTLLPYTSYHHLSPIAHYLSPIPYRPLARPHAIIYKTPRSDDAVSNPGPELRALLPFFFYIYKRFPCSLRYHNAKLIPFDMSLESFFLSFFPCVGGTPRTDRESTWMGLIGDSDQGRRDDRVIHPSAERALSALDRLHVCEVRVFY